MISFLLDAQNDNLRLRWHGQIAVTAVKSGMSKKKK